MSGTDVQTIRHTILNINGARVSEDVSEYSVNILRDKENVLHGNLITIRFVPMYGKDGHVMVAHTMRYTSGGYYNVDLIATNTGEKLSFHGLLVATKEKLDHDCWCGEQIWSFEVYKEPEVTMLDPSDIPDLAGFKDAVKAAKEMLK